MALKKVVYPNLVAELARQGITLANLAEKLGLSQRSVYNKINGDNEFTLAEVCKVQELLNEGNEHQHTIDYIFSR